MSIPPLRYALPPVKSHTFDVQILTTLLTFPFSTGSSKAKGIPDSFTSEVCRFACKTALICKWRITLNFSTISPVNMLSKFSPSFWKSQGYMVSYLVLFLTYFFTRGFKKGLQVYFRKYIFLTRSCVLWMTPVSLSTPGRSARDCYPGHSVPVHGAAFASRPGTF